MIIDLWTTPYQVQSTTLFLTNVIMKYEKGASKNLHGYQVIKVFNEGLLW